MYRNVRFDYWIVTDQGSHFTLKLYQNMEWDMHMSHHLTKTYSPWAIGSAERFCKDLQDLSGSTQRIKIPPQNWPSIIECVQCVINHAPLKRLVLRDLNIPSVFRTRKEVFSSHKPKRPLLRPLAPRKYVHINALDEMRDLQLININKCQYSME